MFRLATLWKKTTWVGLGFIITGSLAISGGDIPGGINTILLGLGMIAGRDAITKLQGE